MPGTPPVASSPWVAFWVADAGCPNAGKTCPPTINAHLALGQGECQAQRGTPPSTANAIEVMPAQPARDRLRRRIEKKGIQSRASVVAARKPRAPRDGAKSIRPLRAGRRRAPRVLP